MKKIALLFVTLAIGSAAAAEENKNDKADKFGQCVHSVLNASCNTSVDRGAPPDWISQGADACYIVRESVPEDSKERQRYSNMIANRYLKSDKEQNDAIRKCIATPAALKACSLSLIARTRDYYPVCQEALEGIEPAPKKKTKKKK